MRACGRAGGLTRCRPGNLADAPLLEVVEGATRLQLLDRFLRTHHSGRNPLHHAFCQARHTASLVHSAPVCRRTNLHAREAVPALEVRLAPSSPSSLSRTPYPSKPPYRDLRAPITRPLFALCPCASLRLQKSLERCATEPTVPRLQPMNSHGNGVSYITQLAEIVCGVCLERSRLGAEEPAVHRFGRPQRSQPLLAHSRRRQPTQ